MRINRQMESVGLALKNDLDPLRLLNMVEDIHPFSDQGDGSFIKLSVECQCPVIGDKPHLRLSKMIPQILWSCSHAGHSGRKSRKRRLASGTVFSGMIGSPVPK